MGKSETVAAVGRREPWTGLAIVDGTFDPDALAVMKAEYPNVERLVSDCGGSGRRKGQHNHTKNTLHLTSGTSSMSLLMRKMNHGSHPLLSWTVLCAKGPLEQEPLPPANSLCPCHQLIIKLIFLVLPRRNEDSEDCLGVL